MARVDAAGRHMSFFYDKGRFQRTNASGQTLYMIRSRYFRSFLRLLGSCSQHYTVLFPTCCHLGWPGMSTRRAVGGDVRIGASVGRECSSCSPGEGWRLDKPDRRKIVDYFDLAITIMKEVKPWGHCKKSPDAESPDKEARNRLGESQAKKTGCERVWASRRLAAS